jgi:hypothetical protein
MRKYLAELIILFSIFLMGCSSEPKVEVKSAEFVEKLQDKNYTYTYEGRDIVRLELDFTFPEDLAPEFKANSKEHQVKVYTRISEWALLRYDSKTIKSIEGGFWIKRSGKNYAKSMTLYFLVPKDRQKEEVTFQYIEVVLGDPNHIFEYSITP